MASVYRHHNAWQAGVTVAGANHKKNFRTRKEAETWAAQLHGELQNAHAPLLGGPARVTVGRTLYEYAHFYTVHKRGAKQEITLINRYLAAAGLPAPQLRVTEQGGVDLTDAPPATELPFSFAGLREKRAASREKTNASRAGLALLPVAQVSARTMLKFMSAMRKDGLTDSTIQKSWRCSSTRSTVRRNTGTGRDSKTRWRASRFRRAARAAALSSMKTPSRRYSTRWVAATTRLSCPLSSSRSKPPAGEAVC
jgi:hypothetical protein